MLTKSVALQLARWTRAIPAEFRDQAEEILVAAARAGAGLRALAAICAEIRYRTAPPDPEDEQDRHLDRGVSFDTTLDGAGVIRGDLTPECAAMVQAVWMRCPPRGGGDLRTRPQRYHDALEEAMHRLLASGPPPSGPGSPSRPSPISHFTELVRAWTLDSEPQDGWIAGYRARWAAQRAAAQSAPGTAGPG